MRKSIKVIAFLKDHQDGGGSTTVYPSLDALKEDKKLTDEELQAIIDEEDPYENGEISEDTIEVDVDEEGNITLAKSFYFSWGQ